MSNQPRRFPEIMFAVYITSLVTVLYYHWFAVRDRYEVFLYYHDMGPGFDTAPFGAVTLGRYGMTGLVASGAVMALYLAANLLLGRVIKGYRAPAWWRQWLWCAPPLLLIVPGIVMTVNDPTMPPGVTGRIMAALLAGLALALYLGDRAADRPGAFIILVIDAASLALLLMALTTLEDLPGWLAQGRSGFITALLFMLIVGLGLMTGMTVFYLLLKQNVIPDGASWLAAGAGLYYLVLPLSHHLFFSTDAGSFLDPSYFAYITTADNYFASHILSQLVVWLVFVAGGWGIAQLRLGLWNTHQKRRKRTTAHLQPGLPLDADRDL